MRNCGPAGPKHKPLTLDLTMEKTTKTLNFRGPDGDTNKNRKDRGIEPRTTRVEVSGALKFSPPLGIAGSKQRLTTASQFEANYVSSRVLKV